MTERVEPDGHKFKLQSGFEYASDYPRHSDSLEENREPLFSAETIQEICRFQTKARDIEHTTRKLEAAIQGTINREEILELIGEMQSHADNIAELKEVFSDEQ